MKPVQALFFDLDETLLDGSCFQESIVRTCGKIAASQPGLDAARLVEANRKVWRGYWPEIKDKWMLGALDGASVSLQAWRLTLRACGCNDESIARLALQTHSQLGREAHRLFDDARELFTSLRRARIPLALITNGASDTQRDKLRALDIEHWFDVVVISGEVGIAKPDAAAFGLALNKLPVERENVWHVGDSLTTDVAGAKAAGLTAVWLNRGGLPRREGDPEPDVEIRSLSNLMALLS
ncbi:MAG: HAD family hydrolase [Ardenticatenaceae bacterium]|nr:HAD family hydrolase [Ardenticatenaceae bacterium]